MEPLSSSESPPHSPIVEMHISIPSDRKAPTALPKIQMLIILLLLLCEPVTASIIFPFVAKLVGELDIAKGNPATVGYYVGVIESLFFLSQGLTVLQWGRLSDKIGRRPVLLLGLFGLGASMLSFGVSSTFTSVVLSRSIAGFLNGNTGVVKTMLAELTDESNRALAFSMFPVTWILGSTIGPLIGGALQHPAERIPGIFGNSYFWRTYPYFLPCSFAAALSVTAFVLGSFLLKETLPSKIKNTRKLGYQSVPMDSPVTAREFEDDDEHVMYSPTPIPALREVFVRPVFVAILNYSSLAFLDISFFAIITVFLAVPLSAGGLDFPPPKIGVIMAALGILSGLAQILLFPRIHARFGPKPIFRAALGTFFIVFPLFPLMHIAAITHGPNSTVVWILICVLIAVIPIIDMGYSCSFMFIASSSPSPLLLGATNGLAQTAVSFTRALGPAGATTMFTLSMERQWAGGYGVFWMLCGLTIVALGFTRLLPKITTKRVEDEV